MQFLVIPLGLEPKTHSLEGCCSIHLSYGTIPLGAANILLFPENPNPAVLRKDPEHHEDVRGLEERQLPTLPTGVSVPSAMVSLTSLFGMGRGGSSPL